MQHDAQSADTAHLTADGVPVIGASAAVFAADGRVLIVRRGKEPFKGMWSLPGGHIEPGETPLETARREVREETGVTAEIVGLAALYAVPERTASGDILRRFGLAVCFGRILSGDPRASGDAADARLADLAELPGLAMTERCAELVAIARDRLTSMLANDAGRAER